MNFDRAIEIHREALLRLVSILLASVERVSGGAAGVVPRFMRANVLRGLGPAESALRRLVYVTARLLAQAGFSVTPRQTSATGFPKGGIPRADDTHAPAFPLFDAQQQFEPRLRKSAPGLGPRVWLFDGTDQPFEAAPEPVIPLPDDPVDAARLCGRLTSMKRALEDLPKQAKRMLRAQARRAQKPPGPGRAAQLRPGFPPGHVAKPMREVDEVLRQCCWLARRVVEPANTS